MSKSRTPSDIYPSVYYQDAPAAIEWLCRAFGFRKRLVVPGPDGGVAHSELSFGTGVIMVASEKKEFRAVSPRRDGTVTGGLSIYVEDPDAHFAAAKAAGAQITRELKDEEYGARGYMAEDPEGHWWYFGNYRPGGYWED
ncbi:MAG TPA: VOC family protein [Nevskiaceae bacterium]|nr:VOC family protein [Nevskiaceae bacterium]